MLRFLLFAMVAACLCSCASTQQGSSATPLLIAGERTQKYNLQLDFMKHHFSGLLVVRRLPDNEIRILASTYFGLSLFDFSLRENVFLVNSCIEPMRKEKILRLLESDLKSLFLTNNKTYRLSKKDSASEKRTTGRSFGKTVITLSHFTSEQPEQIRIRHPWIGLTLQVNQLTEDITQ